MAGSRTRLRVERIKKSISILQVLSDFGYPVRADAGDREVQFSCDLHGDGRDNKPSARAYPASNSWFCVSETAPVLTDKGWVGLKGAGGSVLDGEGFWREPLAIIPKGMKEAVELRTGAGYHVVLTADHEVMTDKGWIPVLNLIPGNRLEIPFPRSPCFSAVFPLPFSVLDLNTRKYKGYPSLSLPETWSLELGETLGYVFGDGWVTFRDGKKNNHVVGITSSQRDANDARKVFAWMRKWAGGRGSDIHRTVLTISNDGFAEFFSRLGMGKQEPIAERRLPKTLWTAPECALRGFLRGIYATDGSVICPKDRTGIHINLYSVSRGFLEDVQLVLLQFGVRTRLYGPPKTESGHVKRRVCLLQVATNKDMLRFRERIGIANAWKQERLDHWKPNSKGERKFWAKVKEIVPVGVIPVADLSMPADPSFVAGGLRVHNCFACDKTRDSIELVREKSGLGFMESLDWLENKYGLPPLPWESADQEKTVLDEVSSRLDRTKTFKDDHLSLESLLMSVTADRMLPMDSILTFWEACDKLSWFVAEGAVPEHRGRAALLGLRDRILEALKETERA